MSEFCFSTFSDDELEVMIDALRIVRRRYVNRGWPNEASTADRLLARAQREAAVIGRRGYS